MHEATARVVAVEQARASVAAIALVCGAAAACSVRVKHVKLHETLKVSRAQAEKLNRTTRSAARVRSMYMCPPPSPLFVQMVV